MYSVLFKNVVVLMVLQGLVTVVYFCLTWICLGAILDQTCLCLCSVQIPHKLYLQL